MSKRCCEWHDHLPEMYQMDTSPKDCFDECGLAGMGTPSVCCRNCPQAKWFTEGRGMSPDAIDYVKEIMALPLGDRP
jgi:hypothetical protein